MRRVLIVVGWLTTLAVSFVSGAYADRQRVIRASAPLPERRQRIIRTNLYDLLIDKVSIPGEGRDGAIDVLGEGLLLVNRRGHSWYVTKERELRPLPLQVPINVSEFESDSYNAKTIDRDRFAVKDILIQSPPTGHRIAASHLWWDAGKNCMAVRVSVIEARLEDVLSGQTGAGSWRTVFTSLCRPPGLIDEVTRQVTLGGGGRLAALSERQLLLTLSEFGAENTYNETRVAPEEIGQTIVIDVGSGRSSVYTRGHRNPQGLAIGTDGRIWETEHGARGGDELNLLRPGKHFGSPRVTYGTQYEMMVWPHSKTQGRHDGYEKPVYAWVPSIAVSQLIVIQRDAFPWWVGDLLIGSLGNRTLQRVRVEDGRTIFVEPIRIGHRIRDITEMPTGTIVLKTDDNFLVYVDNVDKISELKVDPVTRGELVAGPCRSCHRLQPDDPSPIGPSLADIVGRRVASVPGFEYSEALRQTGGSWSPERLRQFVANPNTFVPGTKMRTTTTYTEQQLDDLIEYLRTVR
jgi:cytochrome c2